MASDTRVMCLLHSVRKKELIGFNWVDKDDLSFNRRGLTVLTADADMEASLFASNAITGPLPGQVS